jgi:hypothetical protein
MHMDEDHDLRIRDIYRLFEAVDLILAYNCTITV